MTTGIPISPSQVGSSWALFDGAQEIPAPGHGPAPSRDPGAAVRLSKLVRREPGEGVYAYENRPKTMPPKYRRAFQARPGAWAFFAAQPPGYRRTIIWWVVSAKQEATRALRLATLVEECARGRRVGLLVSKPPAE